MWSNAVTLDKVIYKTKITIQITIINFQFLKKLILGYLNKNK